MSWVELPLKIKLGLPSKYVLDCTRTHSVWVHSGIHNMCIWHTCYGYQSGTRVWLSTWKVVRTLWQHTIEKFPLKKYDSIEWQLYEYASSGKWGLDLYSSGAMPVYWLSFVVDSLSDRILPWCQGKFPNYLLGCRSSEREGDLLTANFSTLKKV